MIVALRTNTSTSQTFMVCDDSATGKVLTIFCNLAEWQVDHNAGVLTAAWNYTDSITITGLTANTVYSWAAFEDSVIKYTGSFRTLPATDSDLNLLFITDSDNAVLPCSVLLAAQPSGASSYHAAYISEWGYYEAAEFSAAPASAASLTALHGTDLPFAASDYSGANVHYKAYLDSYRLRHKYYFLRDGKTAIFEWLAKFQRKIPCRFMWDNHEIYTVTSARSNPGTGGGPDTPAASHAMPRPGSNLFDAGLQAYWEYYFRTNPVTDLTGTTSKPLLQDGTMFVPFFTETLANTIQVFQIDELTYSDASDYATNDLEFLRTHNDADRIGALQLNQLTAVNTAVTNYAADPNTKLLIFVTGRGHQILPDSTIHTRWAGPSGIHKNVSDNCPAGKNVLVITGDTHRPLVRVHDYYTDGNPVLGVTKVVEMNCGMFRMKNYKQYPSVHANASAPLFDPFRYPRTAPSIADGERAASVLTAYTDIFLPNGKTFYSSSNPTGCKWTYGEVIRVVAEGRIYIRLRNAVTRALLFSAYFTDGAAGLTVEYNSES